MINKIKCVMGISQEAKDFRVRVLFSVQESIKEELKNISSKDNHDHQCLFIQMAIITLYNYHAELNHLDKIVQYPSCNDFNRWDGILTCSSIDNMPDMRLICNTNKTGIVFNSITRTTIMHIPLCEEAKMLESFLLNLIPNKQANIANNIKFIDIANQRVTSLYDKIRYSNDNNTISLIKQVKQYLSLPFICKENIIYFINQLDRYKKTLDSMTAYLQKMQSTLFRNNSFSYFKNTELGYSKDIQSINLINNQLTELLSLFNNILSLSTISKKCTNDDFMSFLPDCDDTDNIDVNSTNASLPDSDKDDLNNKEAN